MFFFFLLFFSFFLIFSRYTFLPLLPHILILIYIHLCSFAISQSRYRLFVQFSDTCFSYERSYIFYCDYLSTLYLFHFGSVAMEFGLSSQKSILDAPAPR